MATLVLRMIAFGLMTVGLLWFGEILYQKLQHKPLPGFFNIVFKTLVLLAGLVLMVKSRALARHWTEDFDE